MNEVLIQKFGVNERLVDMLFHNISESTINFLKKDTG